MMNFLYFFIVMSHECAIINIPSTCSTYLVLIARSERAL